MQKVYLLIEGMFWEGGGTTGVYRDINDAKEAALETVRHYNAAIKDDEFFQPLPLEPEVAPEGLYWGNNEDFYVEVVETEVL